MDVSEIVIDNLPIIVVSGKIDAVTSKDLDHALKGPMDQNKTLLVVDMEKVEYLHQSQDEAIASLKP